MFYHCATQPRNDQSVEKDLNISQDLSQMNTIKDDRTDIQFIDILVV